MTLIEQLFPIIYLIALAAIILLAVAISAALRGFIGLIKDLVDQNARTMMFTASLNNKMAQQHNEIIKAIECLTEKIKAMVSQRAYQVGSDD